MTNSTTPVTENAGRPIPGSDGDAAVAEFIRTRGVTRCPTACVLPTQGLVAAADRAALEAYAAERDQLRRARAAARARPFSTVEFARLEGR